MSERLAVDISNSYESGLLGKKGTDSFPCNGSRITRVEFDKSISSKTVEIINALGIKIKIPGLGQGNAFPSDTNLPDVSVHYWLDMGTKLTYSLKVWVED